MKDKRFATMKALAKQMNYPDAVILDLRIEGFQITGQQKCSGLYEENLKPAESTREQLFQPQWQATILPCGPQ